MGEGDETQRSGIDAIPYSGEFLGSVIEYMPEVDTAADGKHFGPFPPWDRIVSALGKGSRGDRPSESGPSAAGIIFRIRSKKRFAADNIYINARFKGFVVGVGKRLLSSCFLGNGILEVIKLIDAVNVLLTFRYLGDFHRINMAVAAGVLFKITLMIRFSRIEVLQRADLYRCFVPMACFHLRIHRMEHCHIAGV